MATGYNYITMTVILAALYDNGKGAILVSDKMRTVEHPQVSKKSTAEAPDVVKIEKLNDYVYMLHAGNMDLCLPYIEELKREIRQDDKPRKVIRKAAGIYRKYRQKDVENKVLLHYGFNSMDEYKHAQNLSAELVSLLDDKITHYFSPFDLILVCLEDDVYSIYGLADPGFFMSQSFGSAVTGSGARFAMEVVTQEHTKSMSKDKVKEVLLKAKKMAEQDEHVGAETEIVELPEV